MHLKTIPSANGSSESTSSSSASPPRVIIWYISFNLPVMIPNLGSEGQVSVETKILPPVHEVLEPLFLAIVVMFLLLVTISCYLVQLCHTVQVYLTISLSKYIR